MLVFVNACFCLAQKSDFQWVFGTERVEGSSFEINNIQIDFNERPAKVSEIDSIDIEFYNQRTAISNTEGHLIFMSNGCSINDRFGNMMVNGDSLNPGFVHDYYCDEIEGWNVYPGARQTMLALPQPEHDSIWYLFYIDTEIIPSVTTRHLQYSIINTNRQNGLGEVMQKNIKLDTLPEFGKMNAVYSANLSTWFLLSAELESDVFDIFTLDSTGVSFHSQQSIGEVTPEGSGPGYFTRFSPDGQKFAVYCHLTGLELFDFDRTTGTLSNPIFIPETRSSDSLGYGGLEFSPDGRYLYVGSGYYLDQYDLEAPDLEVGRVRIAIMESDEDEFFKPYFAQLQLGPDCRLYIFCISCSFVHIIHRPDEAGTACMLEQRAIETPSPYFRGAPLYPKYRMRALGDTSSICDHVTATIFSSTNDPPDERGASQAFLYPNPATTEVRVLLDRSVQGLRYAVYDLRGQSMSSGFLERLSAGTALRLSVGDWPAGTYIVQLSDEEGRSWAERVVVMD
ncbi:hypothetical protein CEQ90_18435 [Lewinellaceae bacterium SD302]|nr:hypothetical protein CEQ90_18435 [Lewinellaceae bacterium SD302]